MVFEHDIFISYAHGDNIPLQGKDGWISQFHHILEIRLRQLLGKPPRIWRDEKLQGNDYFSDVLLEKLPEVALLVSILSPNYVSSEWCLRELQKFCETAVRGRVGNQSRVFKVIKTDLPLEKHPAEIAQLLGYPFLEMGSDGRPKEFSDPYDSELGRKYWDRLDDLAYDIMGLLRDLEKVENEPEALADEVSISFEQIEGKTIYLAETMPDFDEVRAKIRRELLLEGHTVLPTEALPLQPEDFCQAVKTQLAQCDLSVHPLSYHIQSILQQPKNLDTVMQQLQALRCKKQIELSTRRASNPDNSFSRILWLPANSRFGQEKEGEFLSQGDSGQDGDFLRALQSDPDFLRTGLEDLKTLIHDRLNPRPIGPVVSIGESMNASLQLYLDCDERDFDDDGNEMGALYEFLEQQFQVVLPEYSQWGVKASEEHIRQCDAVLLYYGKASGLWLQRRLRALQKTLYGRTQPLLAQAVYVAAPLTPNKEGFDMSEMPVIHGGGEFAAEQLQPFLTQLQSSMEEIGAI